MDNGSLNIIGTLNTLWQPAITSTPLKQKKTKCENNSFKNLGLNKPENLLNSILNNYQNINKDKKPIQTCKKNLTKNKQSFHFVESSSSADEDDAYTSTKNSDVKINLLSYSRIREKEIDIKFEEAINSSFKDVKPEKKKNLSSKINKKHNAFIQNQDKLFWKKIEVSPMVNIKGNSKNLIKRKKTGEKNKIIKIKVKKKKLTTNNLIEKECNTSIKKVNIKEKSNKKVSSPTNNVINDVSEFVDQFLNNKEKLEITENNKIREEDDIISKTSLTLNAIKKKINSDVGIKRRGTKILNSKIPKKKVKKKQLQENMQNSIENYLKSTSECENKNSSHQLFSESRKQELINSLNMTLQEENFSKQNNISRNSLLPGTYENLKKCNETIPDQDFKILNIKKVVAVQAESEYNSNENNSAIENEKHEEKLITNNNFIQLEPPYSANTSQNSKSSQNDRLKDEKKNCKNSVTAITKNIKNNFKNGKSPELNKNKKFFKESPKNTDIKLTCIKKSETLLKFSTQDVFKKTNQLTSFIENQPGCFTKECWSLKNFKCGILKLKPKSKIGSQTAYENSYFGGVILKGVLKIYVGQQKIELQKGGMAFVPPLTEWKVINLKKTEAVMYYWFGRFRA